MNWKPLKELPLDAMKTGVFLLLAHKPTGIVTTGYYEWLNGYGYWYQAGPQGYGRFKPTHWMPLPEPPNAKA